MKTATKIVKRLTSCFDCDGRGEKSYFTGEGESGYQHGVCKTCGGKGSRMVEYDKCKSCGHSTVHFSKGTKRLLAKTDRKDEK